MYISNFACSDARNMILVSIPMFLGMGNHMELFSEPKDCPGDPNSDVGAGGQGPLHGVNLILMMQQKVCF